MPQTFPLKQLHEIAETHTATAAASLGALMQHLQRHEAKLGLLLQYRDEYRGRLRDAESRGLDGVRLRNFHDFLERLEVALAEQRATVDEAKRAEERGRDAWRSLDSRSKAFDKLSQRFDTASRRKAAHIEQKEQDAHAARLAIGKRALCF